MIKNVKELSKIIRYDDSNGDNSLDIDNLFCEYFGDVYNSNFNPTIDTDNNEDVINNNKFEPVELRLEDIVESIVKMNKNASMRPGGIPGIFISNCRMSIFKALFILFNKIIRSCMTLDKWKLSYTIPVYKIKGDKSGVKSYRPISIMSSRWQYDCAV